MGLKRVLWRNPIGNSYSLELWRTRLGHFNANSVKMFQGMLSGMDLGAVGGNVHSFACEGCVKGKQTRQPFLTDGGTCATKISKLVHFDICKPMKTMFIGGTWYFLTSIDNF